MKQFITIGTKVICEELIKPITPYPSNYNTKPYGGLWLTEYEHINSNEWLMYLMQSNSRFFYKFSSSACVISLKENAKILIIDSQNDLENAFEQYPSKESYLQIFPNIQVLDYEAIADDYDGVYVNPHVLEGYKDWDVKSLILFNTSCIDSYRSVEIGYESFPLIRDKQFFIISESNEKHIESPNQDFLILFNEILNIFQQNTNSDCFDSTNFCTLYSSAYLLVGNFLKQIHNDYLPKYEYIVQNSLLLKSGNITPQKIEMQIYYLLMVYILRSNVRNEVQQKRIRINEKKMYI